MTTAKTPAPIDTSAGTAAYNLALAHQADLQPRLPADTISGLAADLTLLGAAPVAAIVTTPPPAEPVPPSLADATAQVVTLVTAMHQAVHGAKASAAVRKAYGVSGKAVKAPKAVGAEGEKLFTQCKNEPAQALSLGILPSDVSALGSALLALTAAESAAGGRTARLGPTAAQRHAAAVGMRAAVARIAGAGVLAYATNAAVRAQFEALVPVKSGKA